jgi:hypothetical protein
MLGNVPLLLYRTPRTNLRGHAKVDTTLNVYTHRHHVDRDTGSAAFRQC